jgi:hypothetical protein
MKSSLAHKFNRAEALGWSRSMPSWLGPCAWLKKPKKERREMLGNLRRMRANNAWMPVVNVEGGA